MLVKPCVAFNLTTVDFFFFSDCHLQENICKEKMRKQGKKRMKKD